MFHLLYIFFSFTISCPLASVLLHSIFLSLPNTFLKYKEQRLKESTSNESLISCLLALVLLLSFKIFSSLTYDPLAYFYFRCETLWLPLAKGFFRLIISTAVLSDLFPLAINYIPMDATDSSVYHQLKGSFLTNT